MTPTRHLQHIGLPVSSLAASTAFDVADIDAAFAALTAAGLTPLEPAPVFLDFRTSGCR